jgi:transcriptional regulator GlxA family with amidase domain
MIAMECGFYDLPHLDKAFRKRFGHIALAVPDGAAQHRG